MIRNTATTNKPKEFIISATIIKIWIGVMTKALKGVHTEKKLRLPIDLRYNKPKVLSLCEGLIP